MKRVSSTRPTSDPQLNALLHELVGSVQAILGEQLCGVYLQGSFALGDWDQDSDVDFVVVIEDEPEGQPQHAAGPPGCGLSPARLDALQAMHGRLYDLETHWAQHLEGSYFPRGLLKRADPTRTPLMFLDNTARVLEPSPHDNTLVVRWVLREYGIPLAGPDPKTLIDPVEAADLRQEVQRNMAAWVAEIFADPQRMNNRWYQPYAVLNFSRMLYTIATGRVCSKLAGARWAQNTLDPRWTGLIQRAWAERPDPSRKVRLPADPADFAETLEFVRYALEQSHLI